jgi:hypothetical protein
VPVILHFGGDIGNGSLVTIDLLDSFPRVLKAFFLAVPTSFTIRYEQVLEGGKERNMNSRLATEERYGSKG